VTTVSYDLRKLQGTGTGSEVGGHDAEEHYRKLLNFGRWKIRQNRWKKPFSIGP
jgi:hypothetical protein